MMSAADPTQAAVPDGVDRLFNDSDFSATDSEHTELSEVPNPDDVEVQYEDGYYREPPAEFLFGKGIIKMAMVDPDATVVFK